MARYWLGSPEWKTDGAFSYWGMPAGGLAMLDLRSTPQCAATITPQGKIIVVTANATTLAADYRNLGTDPEVIMTEPQKRLWESELNLQQTLVSDRLMDVVTETLTVQSDPTGQDRCPPLIPTTRRKYDLWIAGLKVRSVAWDKDGPHAVPVIDLLKRMYRESRQDCLDGKSPPQHYRKVLGYWVRKYGIPYRMLQPSDLPDESDLPPDTTITESFNTSDGDTLGPNLSWTELTGDIDIVSNQASVEGVAVGSLARADSDLSSSDHYSQVTIKATGTCYTGCTARKDSTATLTFYFAVCDDVVDKWQTFKFVAGTATSIGTDTTSLGGTVGDVIRVSCNGSSIERLRNGSSQNSVTDTAISGNLRCGIRGYYDAGSYATKALIDNFEAADLSVGGGILINGGLVNSSRLFNGGLVR